MQAEATNKTIDKNDAKPKPTKMAEDQEKIINQLRQEVKALSKAFSEMQRKPDIQAINIAIPRKLLSRVNAYLLEYAKDTGETISLSDFICEAMDMYLYGEEQNKRLEDERARAEMEQNKGKT